MADIRMTQRAGQGLASVVLRRGALPDLGAVALWPTGPGQWLAHGADAAPDWADALAARAGPDVAVIDQSGAYRLFAIEGADAHAFLQKAMAVDLSPARFGEGAVVVSMIAHIGVIVRHDGPGRFTLAVFRSFADSFAGWFDHAVAMA